MIRRLWRVASCIISRDRLDGMSRRIVPAQAPQRCSDAVAMTAFERSIHDLSQTIRRLPAGARFTQAVVKAAARERGDRARRRWRWCCWWRCSASIPAIRAVSFTGDGDGGAQPRSGRSAPGRRPAVVPVRRAGLPVPADAGRDLPLMFRNRDGDEAGVARQHDRARRRLRAAAGRQLRLATLHWTPGALRQSAGGVVGSLSGTRLARQLQAAGRDAAAAGGLDGRRLAGLPRLLAPSSIASAPRSGRGVDWLRSALHPARAKSPRARSASEARKEVGRGRAEEGHAARRAAHRGAGAGAGEERARREGTAGAAVRRAAGRRAAAAASCSTIRREREAVLFARGARGDVAPGRDQAARISASRSKSSPCIPGPVVTRFEMQPGARREGQPDHRPRQGPGARAVGDQRARGRGDSRQVGDGPRDPEREARDGHAGRDHQVAAPTKK